MRSLFARVTGGIMREGGSQLGNDVEQALAFIDAHLGERLTLLKIADELHLSPYHFAHVFKRTVGIAPHQYVMQRRLERARQLIAHTKLPIVTIALELGYANQSHFSEAFHRATGVTPLSYRLRGQRANLQLQAQVFGIPRPRA